MRWKIEYHSLLNWWIFVNWLVKERQQRISKSQMYQSFWLTVYFRTLLYKQFCLNFLGEIYNNKNNDRIIAPSRARQRTSWYNTTLRTPKVYKLPKQGNFCKWAKIKYWWYWDYLLATAWVRRQIAIVRI